MEQKQLDIKDLTDIQLMVLIKDFSEEFSRLEGDLKLLNSEYARRCEEFKKSKETSSLKDSQEILDVESL